MNTKFIKITFVLFLTIILSTSCSEVDSKGISSTDKTTTSSKTDNTTKATTKENSKTTTISKDENTPEQLDKIIPISINKPNEQLKYAYVYKNKLVDYINSSNNELFDYNDFKQKVGFAIDDTFLYADDFSNGVALVKKVEKYKKENGETYASINSFLINEKGERLAKEREIVSAQISSNGKILIQGPLNQQTSMYHYYIYDNKGNMILDYGEHTNYERKGDIIIFNDEGLYDLNTGEFTSGKLFPHKYDSYEYKHSFYSSVNSPFTIKDKGDSKIIPIVNKEQKMAKINFPLFTGDYITEETDGKAIKIYNKNLEEVFANTFSDFYHLGDNYYAGASYKLNEDFSYAMHSNRDSFRRQYRADAIFDGENLSEFKYFTLKYLGNDEFYVFDGEKYYFMNMKTKEQTRQNIPELFEMLNFKVYDNLIVGEGQNSTALITDKKVQIVSTYYEYDGIKIFTKLKNFNFMNNEYPIFELKDAQIAQKINDKIVEIFGIGTQNINDYYNENKTAIINTKSTSFYIEKIGKLITVTKANYNFGFGAHPVSDSTYITFDINNGELITIDDLFIDKESAYDFILQQIWKQVKEDDYSELYELEKIKNNSYNKDMATNILLGKYRDDFSFYFDDKGLNIFYNAYEIACYAAGPQQFVISYEQIKPYLKEEIIEKLELK